MSKLNVRSDDVIASGVKLKVYIQNAIEEVSDDYLDLAKKDAISKDDTLELIRKYRNALLCIKEICKTRNKF